jgi:hypothetical protein
VGGLIAVAGITSLILYLTTPSLFQPRDLEAATLNGQIHPVSTISGTGLIPSNTGHDGPVVVNGDGHESTKPVVGNGASSGGTNAANGTSVAPAESGFFATTNAHYLYAFVGVITVAIVICVLLYVKHQKSKPELPSIGRRNSLT